MVFVRDAWYVAAWSDEVVAERPFAIKLLGEPVVIYRKTDGTPVALEDRCVHRLAPLSLGRCEGDTLRCMYHGMLYAADGQVVEIPGQDLVPKQARVRSYPVVERHSWIWVWMGEAASADPSLIPPAVGRDDPDWILGHGHIDYEAEARLINDNLLDFSHLTYVHANSFQAGADHAESLPKLTTLERGVRASRWIRNAERPPIGGDGRAVATDNFGSYDFLVPGVLLMWSGSYPVGTADELADEAPDMSQASGLTFTSQAVTPMTEKTSRYFFSWGPHKDHGDAAMRDAMMGVAKMAFEEDRIMIEAQQRVIDDTPNPVVMPSAHDKGVTIFNRMMERLARQSAAQDAA